MLNDGCDSRCTALEANRLNQLAWHRGAEAQTHGANGQAGCVGVFTFAAEVGRERLTHLVFVALLVLADQTIGHGHALAIHQRHLAARSQAAVTGQHGVVLRVLGSVFIPVALLEHGLAVLAINQLHGNALAHAFRGTPDALLQTVRGGGTRQAQRKVLLLVHLLISVRCNIADLRATRLKLIAGVACQRCAGDRFELRVEFGRAFDASGQVLGKVEYPFFFAVPAACALGCHGVRALQRYRRCGLGVAKAHTGAIELNHHLADLAHIALGAELPHPDSVRCCQAQPPQQAGTQHFSPTRPGRPSIPTQRRARHVHIASPLKADLGLPLFFKSGVRSPAQQPCCKSKKALLPQVKQGLERLLHARATAAGNRCVE